MEISQLISLMVNGTIESLYMTLVSTALSYLFGIPIGVILFITDKGGIAENKVINMQLGVIVNLLRSVPFIILLVAIIPFTRFVVGTSIGLLQLSCHLWLLPHLLSHVW